MLNSDGQKNPGQNEDYKSATNVEFSLFHTNNSSFLNIYSHFGISLKVLLWNLDELVKFFHCMKKKLGYHYKRWKEAKVDGISSQKKHLHSAISFSDAYLLMSLFRFFPSPYLNVYPSENSQAMVHSKFSNLLLWPPEFMWIFG